MKISIFFATIAFIVGNNVQIANQLRYRRDIIPRNITARKFYNGSITYNLLAITDMDKDNREAPDKYNWRAVSRRGILILSPDKRKVLDLRWFGDQNITSGLNYKGRAMELSGLSEFNGRLLSPDDKTGMLYEIRGNKVVVECEEKAIPWLFLNSGPGNTTKGMKAEWLTVKDDLLYVGGHGCEYRNKSGHVISEDPMWIKIITKTGEVKSENWKDVYTRMRNQTGYPAPGYLTHEAVQWSKVRSKWYFLPRKASKTIYDEKADETKGANIFIEADPELQTFRVIPLRTLPPTPDIGKHPERGFSAFDFIPYTKERLIIATKSVEVGNTVESYVTIFNAKGKIILPDQKLDGNLKFEGIYFV